MEAIMKVIIKALGFKLTQPLQNFIRNYMFQALSRRADAVMSVVVRLIALHGPQGREDKLCRIQVALPGRQLQLVEAVYPDPYDAISEATRLAGRNLNRALARRSYY